MTSMAACQANRLKCCEAHRRDLPAQRRRLEDASGQVLRNDRSDQSIYLGNGMGSRGESRSGSARDAAISPEVIRRYSSPLGRTAARICEEVLLEVSLVMRGEGDPSRGIVATPDMSEEARMKRCQALSEPAAALAVALHSGELDDPFAGWKILTRYARRLGPRYVEMVVTHPDPNKETSASNVHRLLPRLTLNGAFVGELIAAEPPAFALGLAEERKQIGGLFALLLDKPLPKKVAGPGFQFGHSLLGTDQYLVVHFSFEFYGFAKYDVLVNPSSPVVRAVLQRMVETREYQFFALDRSGKATVFKSDPAQQDLAGLQSNWPKIVRADTTEAQYASAVASFGHRFPESALLAWVCREELAYIDLAHDRLELTPSG